MIWYIGHFFSLPLQSARFPVFKVQSEEHFAVVSVLVTICVLLIALLSFLCCKHTYPKCYSAPSELFDFALQRTSEFALLFWLQICTSTMVTSEKRCVRGFDLLSW